MRRPALGLVLLAVCLNAGPFNEPAYSTMLRVELLNAVAKKPHVFGGALELLDVECLFGRGRAGVTLFEHFDWDRDPDMSRSSWVMLHAGYTSGAGSRGFGSSSPCCRKRSSAPRVASCGKARWSRYSPARRLMFRGWA